MTVRLYDSAARQVRDFVPLVEGQVGIYVCGATPQASPHVGHIRSQVAFDVLRRWLTRRGYQVTLIRNVTDIDDKILLKSAEAGRPWWAHAFRYEREFSVAYDLINVLAPSYEPRATGHIIEMVALVQALLERGHAYQAADGCGDVYFDVHSLPQYGELTRQKLDDLEPAQDADPGAGGVLRKRDPRDFALWKAIKPNEPASASWPTPWGAGRPGWHLECSAMARRYLGPEFDIHGGGLDLRFPHHENERAQSLGAGDRFARYWMHNAWVVMAGEKMSKSLGNVLSITSLTEQVRPVVLRYVLSAPHYRSNIELSEESLAEATAGYERIESFVAHAAELNPDVAGGQLSEVALPPAFAAAMDDDVGTPAAVAVLHDTVRAGNTELAGGNAVGAARLALAVRAMADVLGVDPLDPRWGHGDSSDAHAREALDVLVRAELDARLAARKTRDWATADAIRDRLVRAGIAVEDTAEGARWSLQRPEHGGHS